MSTHNANLVVIESSPRALSARAGGRVHMATRVRVSLLGEDQEFQRMQAAEARDVAANHGFEIEVLFAENNPIVQIQQLFKAVHAEADRRPHAIVAETVTGEGLERVARNATKAGIGWILLNRRVAYLEELI